MLRYASRRERIIIRDTLYTLFADIDSSVREKKTMIL